MSKCFREAVLHLKPYLVKGIPELGLPSIDPLKIKEVTMDTGGTNSVNLDVTLSNLEFIGGSKFELRHVEVDIKKLIWYFELYMPLIKMESDYKASGKILLVDFKGDGRAHGEFGKKFSPFILCRGFSI